MLTRTCDICNVTMNDFILIKYKRSIFQLLRIIPKLFVSKEIFIKQHVHTKYEICRACFNRIEQIMFRNPNTITELRQQIRAMREQEEMMAIHTWPIHTGPIVANRPEPAPGYRYIDPPNVGIER